MSSETTRPGIYDDDVDQLMANMGRSDRIVILPDQPSFKKTDAGRHLRIMWGQHLLDDLVAGCYRSLICAVNADDNSRGIISQVADLLPTSQWTGDSITRQAKVFARSNKLTVVKYDLDVVEILALLRPAGHEKMTLTDLADGFRVVAEMIQRKPDRKPSAAVSFLGAHANALVDSTGKEPTFETVLRTMLEAGYEGDVYPAPYMWESATGVFARYPFPASIDRMRTGGF